MDIKETFDQAGTGLTLYHCLYKEPEGDALKVTCEREVNGRTGKFLFAATHLTKALAFAFSYHDEEIMCNGGIPGTAEEFAIVCDRSRTLTVPRHTRVLAFSGEGFEHVGRPEHDSRQMVGEREIPFKDTTLIFESRNIQDIMAQGLQILSTDRTVDELFAEDFFGGRGATMSQAEWLHSCASRSDFTWENKAQGINPCAALLEAFRKYDLRAAVAPKTGLTI